MTLHIPTLLKGKSTRVSNEQPLFKVVIIMLLAGFIILAIIDEKYRPPFANLAFLGIGGYLAMLIPPSK